VGFSAQALPVVEMAVVVVQLSAALATPPTTHQPLVVVGPAMLQTSLLLPQQQPGQEVAAQGQAASGPTRAAAAYLRTAG
jgi:hypothetical protein